MIKWSWSSVRKKDTARHFATAGRSSRGGNAKALHYMKVAETENIPVHTFVFTPGAYPLEDWPGAAQQIARNLYELAGLRVPVISVFSEGGSGGAEAVGLADRRIMLSHGYYSVISPEGAAAIEGGLKPGVRGHASAHRKVRPSVVHYGLGQFAEWLCGSGAAGASIGRASLPL